MAMYQVDDFRTALKEKMQEKALSGKALCIDIENRYRIKFGAPTLSKILKGTRTANLKEITILCDYFQTPIEKFLPRHDRQEEKAAPCTLSDILRELFDLIDSTSLQIQTGADGAALALSVSLDDVKRANPFYLCMPFPEDGLDENCYYRHLTKLCLFSVMRQLQSIHELIASDHTGMAEMLYKNWKEKMLLETSNYRADCMEFDRNGLKCGEIESIKTVLNNIHDPEGRAEQEGWKPEFPVTLQEFISYVSKQ